LIRNTEKEKRKKKKALRGIFLFSTRGFQFFSRGMRWRCGKFFYGESGEKSPATSG